MVSVVESIGASSIIMIVAVIMDGAKKWICIERLPPLLFAWLILAMIIYFLSTLVARPDIAVKPINAHDWFGWTLQTETYASMSF